jgi:Flp pilus assembly protein TadD
MERRTDHRWVWCLARLGAVLLLSLSGILGCSASSAFYRQGLSALAAGDYARATHALSLALVESPQHVGALTALGIAQYRQEAFDAAVETLNRAQALAPTDPQIPLYLGLAALRQGEVDQARQHLTDFLERTRSPPVQEQTARVLSLLDDGALSEAIREYLTFSLERALQQAERVEALHAQVRELEARQRFVPPPRLYLLRRHR